MTDSFEYLRDSLITHNSSWYAMMRSFGLDNGIRDFAYPYRIVTKNVTTLHRYLLYFATEKKRDAYITVYKYRMLDKNPNSRSSRKECPDYNTAIIDKIAFDMDAHSDGEAAERIKPTFKDTKSLMKFFGNACTAIYTGNSGFHVYIHVNRLMTLGQLERIQKRIIRKFKLKSACDSTIGDPSRVLRIPYTIHSGTDCQVLPIDNHSTIKDILYLSEQIKVGHYVVPAPIRYSTYEVNKLGEI